MTTAMVGDARCPLRTLEQELLDLEDWRPLTEAEFRAWTCGELGPAPEGQLYGCSPCGIPVIYRAESLESAVMSLHAAGALGLVTALLDSPEACQLHAAARVDICIALGDRRRALRALEADVPWAREYVLDQAQRPWRHQPTWQWAREIAGIVAARMAAMAVLDGEQGVAAGG